MLTLDPTQLTTRDNYKLLTGSIIPRPVAFVTTLSDEGTLNGAPFSYFNIVSADPPLISISIQRQGGEMKDTSRNATAQKEFVVHVSDEMNVEKINETSASLPPHQSEIELAELTPVESIKIKVPGIQEAGMRFECMLEKAIPLGGVEGSPSCDLLIGRIVHYHIRKDLYENGRIDAQGLKPISRLAGSYYAKLGETFELKRPK